MGKNDNKSIDTEATRNGTKENSGSESTAKRGRGRPRKSESGEPRGIETEADIPKLVLVDVPDVEILETENTDQKSQEKKSGNSSINRKKKKDVQFELKKEQTAVLIKSVFDIAGSREGMELWKLSKQEAELIAEPLNVILNKNPFVDNVTSKYGDYIALVVALITVFVPRIYVMKASQPKKEKKINYDKKHIGSRTAEGPTGPDVQQSGKNGTSSNEPNRQPTSSGKNISAELYQFIPAIQ